MEIGVRELRRDASRWLARVRGGEVFTITDRGRPVARLVPRAPASGYDALVAAGEIGKGTGRPLAEVMDELDADLPLDGTTSISAILADLRAEER